MVSFLPSRQMLLLLLSLESNLKIGVLFSSLFNFPKHIVNSDHFTDGKWCQRSQRHITGLEMTRFSIRESM